MLRHSIEVCPVYQFSRTFSRLPQDRVRLSLVEVGLEWKEIFKGYF